MQGQLGVAVVGVRVGGFRIMHPEETCERKVGRFLPVGLEVFEQRRHPHQFGQEIVTGGKLQNQQKNEDALHAVKVLWNYITNTRKVR